MEHVAGAAIGLKRSIVDNNDDLNDHLNDHYLVRLMEKNSPVICLSNGFSNGFFESQFSCNCASQTRVCFETVLVEVFSPRFTIDRYVKETN